MTARFCLPPCSHSVIALISPFMRATTIVDALPGHALQPDPPPEGFLLRAVVANEGEKASERFLTFFTDTIRNKNTRAGSTLWLIWYSRGWVMKPAANFSPALA